jgi:23S rRNA pseudouridine955/2504/2580 synthase
MTIKIEAENSNRRLDKFLFAHLNNAPHSFIYKLLRKKRIKINGSRAAGSEILQTGDEIRLFLSEETITSCRKARRFEEAAPLTDIIFEDENLLAVNKPAGIASQGGAHDDNLLARVLYYLQESGAYNENADFTPALCNRLDLNTSGLVICGKNLHALQAVNSLFANNNVKKDYTAVVCGTVKTASAILESLYTKDSKTNTAAAVPLPNTDSAVTKNIIITSYTTLAVSGNYSLLSVSPVTGRSHQIRAHLASIGHPLAGDKKYGGDTSLAPHQLLHCRRLEISAQTALPYPVGTAWEAPLPKDMKKIIQRLFG